MFCWTITFSTHIYSVVSNYEVDLLNQKMYVETPNDLLASCALLHFLLISTN